MMSTKFVINLHQNFSISFCIERIQIGRAAVLLTCVELECDLYIFYAVGNEKERNKANSDDSISL